MAIGRSAAVQSPLRLLLRAGAMGSHPDDQLLERYLRGGDGSEVAFEILVTRHGPMVLSVCRQVLGASDEAEDAFQATFLVLVRRAGAIRNRNSIGSWLHGVARRVALRARAGAARRRERERRAGEELARRAGGGESPGEDLVASLHEEIAGLPEKYRAPVVLCELGGMTHEEAARQLGWPIGSVSGRLSRARDLLRGRFARRGYSPQVSLALLAAGPRWAPVGLVARTTAAALLHGARRSAAPGLATGAATLAEGFLKARLIGHLKVAAGLLLAAGGAIAAGRGGDRPADSVSRPILEASKEESAPPAPPAPERTPATPGRPPVARPPLVLGWHLDVTSLALAPDGRTLASGSRDSTVKLWDLEAGVERATLRGHSAPILALAFSPDGESLASADEARTLKVWDTATGSQQLSMTWVEPSPTSHGPGGESVRRGHQPPEVQSTEMPDCSGA